MSWRPKQEVQSGFTKEKQSQKNHQLSGRLPSPHQEPGVSPSGTSLLLPFLNSGFLFSSSELMAQ